jgi:hypothetical protein
MAFDENDPEQVLAIETLKDLFTEETKARLLAHDLFLHGRAVAEIRRTPDGKIVGLDPLDATTMRITDRAADLPPYTLEFTNQEWQSIIEGVNDV